MAFIIDTGFLYAALDKRDEDHKNVTELLPTLPKNDLILPTLVLVELTHLLKKRLGHNKMRQFISTLDNSPIKFENIIQNDIRRVYELLSKYSDLKLDFVDASITAIAERLNIRQILTVDKRDFNIIRPIHCEHFEIFPQ
ncbi:MAG: PIN domain-containing protein [Deltaproteobacteria bacterium]|nr:PIN domain-containing protein [Deltaproteobacteria bacterium]